MQRYTFTHGLLQEVVYQSLLRPTRQQLHAHLAQVLTTRFPEVGETQPALLAHHYTEAGLGAQALPYWQQAGQQALQRSANLEAIQHLSTGLRLLAALPDTPGRAQQEIAMLIALGPAFVVTKGFAAPEVGQTYTRARELCQQVGDTQQLFAVLGGLWSYHHVGGELQAARDLGEQLLYLAQHAQDPALPVEAHWTLGATLFYLGELSAARDHAVQGMALYDPKQHRSHTMRYGFDLGVTCQLYATWVLWHLGYPDHALQQSHAAQALARQLAHPYSQVFALYFAGFLHQFRREAHRSHALSEALLALSREQGFAFRMAGGTILRGWALALQGRHEEGVAQMRHGLTAYESTGARLVRPYWRALRAEVCGKRGQAEEGLSLLAEALALVETDGERWWEAEMHRLKGTLLLALSPDHQVQAEACLQRALDVARRQEARSLELRATMSLSRLWQHQGKRVEARELLAPIYGWFTEGFDTADLQEAQALLAELGGEHRRA